MKGQPKKTHRRAETVVIVICVVLFLGSGAFLANSVLNYTTGQAAYDALKEDVQMSAPASETPQTGPVSAPMADIDFAALEAVNPDTVGWIRQAGGQIDYPVVQGADNDYYLQHLFTGEVNKLGTIFADFRNAAVFEDPNTVIYGHHMVDGSLFGSLLEYNDQAYAEAHPTMTLLTPAGDYELTLFAGYETAGSNDLFNTDFHNPDALQDFVDAAVANSTFQSGVSWQGEPLVTLVTCTDDFTDARYVLLGMLNAPQG